VCDAYEVGEGTENRSGSHHQNLTRRRTRLSYVQYRWDILIDRDREQAEYICP